MNGPGKPLSRLAIVMPVLDEGLALHEALTALQGLRSQGARLLVVDGGSRDGSAALARPWADEVLTAPRGRGAQMHAGAVAAMAAWTAVAAIDGGDSGAGSDSGDGGDGGHHGNHSNHGDVRNDPVLLFLHADTRLPDGAGHHILIAFAARPVCIWGRFDVRIDASGRRFRLLESLMNARSRFTGIATGDQAMFMRAGAYAAAGGFADIALMEDIAMSRRLLATAGRPICLRARVTTSARRWQRGGFVRTVLTMWVLRAAYALGAPPAKLARWYGYAPRV